ncbi:hypothetical protein DBT_0324 [Dissulfuribacter thermophilus]|uniref:Flavinylation-associated cytochrome domain-containing protein n=1 Tax=Dissulfuribacter thermophilus TaxID=1156395 RepID=A0A1B9F9B1_9BACT|nr:DUF4405 domain-containing protein [Dissulfuribacter thermophilus]OCC16507.1 hypothetical protein DBT_0324 [Dissulfuribacter thermophilus]
MIRRITSLILFWSGFVLTISSIILFIEPHGRVAFWSNWTLMGLTKGQWDDLHLCIGVLFVVTSLFHMFLNWSPLITYLFNKSKSNKPNLPLYISIFITVFVVVGTILNLPPMKQILNLNNAVKSWQMSKLGNPPFGHAELVPLSKLTSFLGYNLDDAIEVLEKSGIKVNSPNTTLKKLALEYNTTPRQLFEIISSASGKKKGLSALPEIPPPGLGMLSLRALCQQFHVDPHQAITKLKNAGIEATADMKIKDIASVAGIRPRKVYNIIRSE